MLSGEPMRGLALTDGGSAGHSPATRRVYHDSPVFVAGKNALDRRKQQDHSPDHIELAALSLSVIASNEPKKENDLSSSRAQTANRKPNFITTARSNR
jgi:hypothetical protein